MTQEMVIDIVRLALYTALQISAPMLLIAMVIGFGISLFQSVTQINEMTLTFVPKMIVFAISLAIFFPWMLKIMIAYSRSILRDHWDKITGFMNNVT